MMHAIDTNVLVRIIIKDDDLQTKKALSYVEKHKEVYISLVVLIETIWVFESCYDIEKSDLIKIIQNILMTTEFVIEHSEVVWLALDEFSEHNLDLTDCIIGALAKFHGYQPVATFDKKAAKSILFDLLT